jgi:hypothetical protein
MGTRGKGMSNLLWLVEAVIVLAAAAIVAVIVLKFVDSFSDNRWD